MNPAEKIFYFTSHPGDFYRMPEGANVMLVASAHWDETKRRLRVRRPPADRVASICIDSGGFSAARKWGRYPFSPRQYADWIRETVEGGPYAFPLDFCATMDYACEPAVDRSTLRTNRDRIKASLRNECACRQAHPALPWLPVLQGDSLDERQFDLDIRRRAGLLPHHYAGVGSVCGRGARAAVEALLFLSGQLPGVRFHGFGLHIRALDHAAAWFALRSWDSYSWTWPPGTKADRPPELLQQPGEGRSAFYRRIAGAYLARTIRPRLAPPTPQLALL